MLISNKKMSENNSKSLNADLSLEAECFSLTSSKVQNGFDHIQSLLANFKEDLETLDEHSFINENKENVSPITITTFLTTPSKPSKDNEAHGNSYKKERTPLSDITHQFIPRRKKVNVKIT